MGKEKTGCIECFKPRNVADMWDGSWCVEFDLIKKADRQLVYLRDIDVGYDVL